MKFPALPIPSRPARIRRNVGARPMVFLGTVLAVALVAFTAAPRVFGYYPEGPKWATGSTVTFQMALGSAGRTLLDGNTSWDTAAVPAPGFWSQQIDRMQFATVTNPSAPLSSGDHVNTVAFSSTVFGQSFGSYTLAVTYYRYSGSTFSEADILFNNHQSFDSYRGNLRYGSNGYAIGDIRRVLAHELGHALGLDHPDQHGQHLDAIMNSVMSNRETLSSDDVAGAQSLYGAPSSSPTPTPTPTPTATPTPTPTPTPNPTPTPTPTPTPAATPAMTLVASPTSVKAGGTAIYTITASIANPNAAVTVSYSMSGTAKVNNQYSLTGTYGKVTIPAGATSGTVTLKVLSAPKNAKTATMTLLTGAGYTVSTPKIATVSIKK